eukprot:TRINITY_DN1984_c0_g1_i2.p1 TRINITY_DN1984_c0_g1~~TRINITY_DN1984_c0_g1_i2.p1  ORF type:complete len:277 (-),score=72.01 TRINITY_DN1984_c0_g1_i2:77-907(-)
MTVGKAKKKQMVNKGGRGGAKKKVADPFLKKEWYEIRAPAIFTNRHVGRTFINKSVGNSIASENIKGRVFSVSLADLNSNEAQSFRVIKLRVDDVQDRTLITNFHGMDFTSEKIKSLTRKGQTLIEAIAEVKTTDGHTLRLFCIGFTKKRPNHLKKACYCQSSQARRIRKKMVEIMNREASSCDIKQLFDKFIPESIGKAIEKECHGIYPLQNVFVWKAKVLKKPKLDLNKLMEFHQGSATSATGEDLGEAIANTYDASDVPETKEIVGDIPKEEQ